MAKRTVIDHKTGFTNEFITEGGKDMWVETTVMGQTTTVHVTN